MRHYLTYQHNVQQFFRKHADKYDGVIVPMSIATSFPSGTYGFIRALCTRHSDVQYAIDPRNAMFQKNWNRDHVREPHKKMAAVMGKPYEETVVERPLQVDDFDAASISDSVKKCIEFQKTFRMTDETDKKLRKYKKLLGLDKLDKLKVPQHLIPPYFQFEEVGDPWYELSVKCLKEALKHREQIPLRPVLHFSNWPNGDTWDSCLVTLTSNDINELWFYPNNFREHDAKEAQLKLYRQAVARAVSKGCTPYVLFGGYFAILMSFDGLAGFANGVGYGEWRNSSYHRGGSAQTRIYILKLHRYIDSADAQSLIDKDPEYFGVGSSILADYVDAEKSVVDMTLEDALNHFMACRHTELRFVSSHSAAEAATELEETVSRLDNIGPLEAKKYGESLERWKEAISPST
jgi:hypothetical protein